MRAAIETFRGLGAEIVEVDTPHAELGLAASWAIAYAEAFAYHRENFFTRSRDYTRSFLHKITGAGLVSAEEYVLAQRLRERVTAEMIRGIHRSRSGCAGDAVNPIHGLWSRRVAAAGHGAGLPVR